MTPLSDPVCGVSGRVAEHTAAELSALRLEGSEERIPFLEEIIPLFARKAPLMPGGLEDRPPECRCVGPKLWWNVLTASP